MNKYYTNAKRELESAKIIYSSIVEDELALKMAADKVEKAVRNMMYYILAKYMNDIRCIAREEKQLIELEAYIEEKTAIIQFPRREVIETVDSWYGMRNRYTQVEAKEISSVMMGAVLEEVEAFFISAEAI